MKTPQEYALYHTDPPYKALIFDCDGTLADTLPVHFQVWSEALQSFGVEMAEAWYFQHAGLSAAELIRLLNSAFGYQLDPTSVNADRLRRYQSLLHNQSFTRYVREIPSVTKIVRANYGDVPMAVASGGERELVEAALDAISLRHYFDVIVSVTDVLQGKPAPDVFLLAAERLGVAPEDCMVYEDSEGGLEAARRAGMPAIDVRLLQQSKARYQANLAYFYASSRSTENRFLCRAKDGRPHR